MPMVAVITKLHGMKFTMTETQPNHTNIKLIISKDG